VHELFICEYDNFIGVFPGPLGCAYLTITTSFAGNGRWFQLIYCLSYALKLRFKFCTASCSSQLASCQLQVATITWPWPWGHCHCYLSFFAWLVWMAGFHFVSQNPFGSPALLTIFFALKLSSSLYSFLSVSRWIPEPVPNSISCRSSFCDL